MKGRAARKTQRSGLELSQAVWLYIASLCSIYLLFPGFSGYAHITADKWRLLCALLLLCIGGWLLLRLELALVSGMGLPKPAFKKPDAFDLLLLCYWALTALSTLLSPWRATAFWGSGRRLGLVTATIFCLSCCLVRRALRPDRTILTMFGVSVSLNCLLALVQLTGRNPLTLYPAGMTYFDADKLYAGTFLGTIGNVDLLSAVFCIAAPLFFVLLLRGRDRRRFWLTLPLALCLAVALRMRVAGFFVGLAGGLLLLPPALARGKRAKLIAFTVVVIIVLAALIGIYSCGERFGGTAAEAAALLHGEVDDSFGSGRIYIWRETLRLVPQRPLLGGGPDTLGLRTDAAFERYDEERGRTIRVSIDNAHNEYLAVLVDRGLPALVCLLGLLACGFFRWLRCAPDDPVTAACGCGAASYAVQAFFGLASPVSSIYFWLALGVLMKKESDDI